MNHLRSTYQEDNEDRMDRGQVGKTLKEIEKSVLKTVLKSHRPDFVRPHSPSPRPQSPVPQSQSHHEKIK